MVRITALMDNNHSENKALIAEHGLSYLLEWEEHRLLFDCGSGPGFWYNARKLGRKLHYLDAVVLSHSHYDHGAGYRDLIELGGGSPLLCTGPDFFQPKFAFDGVRYTDLSCWFSSRTRHPPSGNNRYDRTISRHFFSCRISQNPWV